MSKLLICLLLVSLAPTLPKASVSEVLALWPNSAQAVAQSTPAKPKPKQAQPRKKSKPTPTPTPSPTPKPSPVTYPAPVVDEDDPAVSPRYSRRRRVAPRRKRKPTPTPTPTPTPVPAKRELQPQRYPAPVVDEDEPAVSPLVSALTGTFRLNVKDSDDVEKVSAQTAREIAQSNLKGINVQERLEAPYALAIELRGQTVTIISTRAPRIVFEADGREHVEQLPNGGLTRARANLEGVKLVVMSSGTSRQDFKVIFEPTEGGRLRVTRELLDPRLQKPIVFQSTYDRVADVAHWESFGDAPFATAATSAAATSVEFVVPNGESLVATLNANLTTKEAREGDRFTMTVLEPSKFAGAIIEGHLTNIVRSGRVTGRSAMSLNLDSIRLSNGRTYRFAGIIEGVRTTGEEIVRVDNEGTVENDAQNSRVVSRTAIGTGIGAIIGAIAGGGKGAAIGAIIGAGTGAGSVYVQGKNDLELKTGSEVTIRATGPR